MPRQTSAVLTALNQHFPLTTHLHLKRIKKHNGDLLALLCLAPESGSNSLPEDFSQFDLKIIRGKVPRNIPQNQEELEQAKAVWPVSYVPRKPDPPITFGSEERVRMEGYMRLAFQQAR